MFQKVLNIDFVHKKYHNAQKWSSFKQIQKSSKVVRTSSDIFSKVQKSSENCREYSEVAGTFQTFWSWQDDNSHTFDSENVGSYIYSVKTNGKIDSEAAKSLIMSKLFMSAYELNKNSSVFITHSTEYNLSIERLQQAGSLGQAVEYAAWTPIV